MGETEPGADVDTTAILLISGALYLWGVLSGRLERDDLTAPIVFVAIGGMLAVTGLIAAPAAGETLKPLVEVTLVWVLFSDAAGVPFGEMRRDLGRIVRLLAVGLPLTVLAGWGLAYWLFPELGVWLALLVAAALAPTDAALGLPVVTNRAVPSRVRRLITVESGLNDGIVTPVVMFALAGAASAEALDGAPGMGEALAELGIGLVVGAASGWEAVRCCGGRAVGAGRPRTSSVSPCSPSHSPPMRPPLLFTETGSSRRSAEASPSVRRGRPPGSGRTGVPRAGQRPGVPAGLAGVRCAVRLDHHRTGRPRHRAVCHPQPDARADGARRSGPGRARARRQTVLFVGWFGPRGLASLVFALLALEELGPDADEAVAIIGLTVLLSVLAHGVSADPLASRYGGAVTGHGQQPTPEQR